MPSFASKSTAEKHKNRDDTPIFRSVEFRSAVLEVITPLLEGQDPLMPRFASHQMVEELQEQLNSLAERSNSIEAKLQNRVSRVTQETRRSWHKDHNSIDTWALASSRFGGGVRECDAAMICQGLNLFALQSLPLHNELQHFQRIGHKCIRVCSFFLLFLCLLAFVIWGCYKLTRDVFCGDVVCDYVQIQHEKKLSSKATDVRVPATLCIADTPAQTQIEPVLGEIPYGNLSAKREHAVQLAFRNVVRSQGVAKNASCLMERLPIRGTFGDPMYRYIQIRLFMPESTSNERRQASLLVESQIGGRAKVNDSLYYTFHSKAWTGVEVFLSRRTTIEGDRLGLSRVLPHTYENMYGEEGVGVENTYARSHESWGVNDVNGRRREYSSFYIRASTIEHENTYEPYGLLLLLQDSGGLWTGLASLVAAFLFILFCCCRLTCGLRLRHRHQP